jgi:hypothetical protein
MDSLYKLLSELVPEKSRALLVVLLVLSTVYPLFLLTCYMAHKGFYAYEIFSSILSLVVPFLFMALVLAVVLPFFAALLWGGVIAFLQTLLNSPERRPEASPSADAQPAPEQRSGEEPSKEILGLIAVNVVLLALFIYGLRKANVSTEATLMIVAAPLVFGLALLTVQIKDTAQRRGACWLLLAVAVVAPLFGRDATTNVVEVVLTQFRLGGTMVTVVSGSDRPTGEPKASNLLYGRLLFLSASNLYLEAECPRKLFVVSRSAAHRLEFLDIRTAGVKEFECPPAKTAQ